MKWRLLKKYPGYRVSDSGLIQSCVIPGHKKLGSTWKPLKTFLVRGYPVVTISNRKKPVAKKVHQLIWEGFNGPVPKGKVIDHINRIKTDNRLKNFRLASYVESSVNSTRKSKWGRGIKKRSDCARFEVKFIYKGKYFHVGMFKTLEEAKKAYDSKAKEIQGSFAVLHSSL